jgi:long-subunit acyl-CoA synthetase (AMP-forming)
MAARPAAAMTMATASGHCFVLATPYAGARRPGVVGVALPGISVRVVDPDAADRGTLMDAPDGAQGEIVIRGPNLFSGYWNRPEDTRRAFVDGYFRSGDLAVREADGDSIKKRTDNARACLLELSP